MHCGRVSNLLSAYIDRELAGAEMLQIRRHLDGCPGCGAEHESLARVKSVLGMAPPDEPSADVMAAVMRRWALRQEPAPLPAPRRNGTVDWKSRVGLGRWHRYSLAFSSGCLALVLVGTALALRKPNHPDAVAAYVLPSLVQSEERLPVSGPAGFSLEPWTPEPEWRVPDPPPPSSLWDYRAGGMNGVLVSYSTGSPYRFGR